jgi:hypothetical protein
VQRIREQRDKGVPTYVCVSIWQWVDPGSRLGELIIWGHREQLRLRISIVSQKPNDLHGVSVILAKKGLIDGQGKAISSSALRAMLREESSKHLNKCCVLFVEMSDRHDVDIDDLAEAMLDVYTQSDHEIQTDVFLILAPMNRNVAK